ncbi:MAG TPA: NAD(P)/FAD-dependent oxidoreductase [Thiotrichaceae bacterium]|jgi:NADH dehydrogenase|nr:NAD(P)/FAD-dependent oxidoreductase [Thiotrichaceae bacterium]HIM07971.1 NAD(P)/FAD-dependent oxidoreductase [Gammaproteobacteria bacterium]
MNDSTDLHHIVIVGGGAGGLELAARLGRKLGKKKKAEITLIDATRTHLWKPLLHEVAAGTLNSYEDELSYLALAYKNNFTSRVGRMDTLDREKQEISLEPTLDENGEEYIPRRTFHYDSLIIAVGSQTNDFGIKGIKEHCMFLDTRTEADLFHQRLLRDVYAAHTETKPLRKGQLKVAIAGAGATGVELSAELHEAFGQLVEFGLDQISTENDIKISIIEAADRILPALPPRLSEKTEKALNKINIEVLSGHRISEATEEGFVTDKGGLVPAEIKIWAAGIKAPDFLKEIAGLETNRSNQLIVKTTLETTRDENIFAMGDCAACPMEGTDNTVPPRAQAANQQATMLAKTMVNRLKNKPLPTYKYVDYGSLINLSRYTTVGNMMGNLLGKSAGSVMIEGLLARFVYMSLYKMHQVVVLGIIRVTLTTIANFLTQRTKTRMKLH